MMQNNKMIEILIVEDDEGHTELVRRNLRRVGLVNTITQLRDGETALDYVFCRGDYSGRDASGHLLILLDICMPGISGEEVLRQIKADPVQKRTPVIMLTTMGDTREINRCYDLGCSVYVQKPGDTAAFIEAIAKLGLFIEVVQLPMEDEKQEAPLTSRLN
jgi:CheY-like chemotaxis protein